ncbi:zinc ribbon domain-containing protein [Candidatus Sumerlaeota bacterium]|nr:zinc ribbon domain-containing protein [Candidatus Sumerlaeota bacterium]
MPIYEYVCKKCDHRFETLVMGSEKAECPKCRSKSLAKQFSAFAVASRGEDFGGGEDFCDADSPGPCGTCGDPRGPGACGMDDLD